MHDLIFRPPQNSETRCKWAESIEKFQKFDGNSTVCIKHFKSSDIEIRGKVKCLKTGAVPTIFQLNLPTILHNNDNAIVIISDECGLKEKLDQKEHEILRMKIEHDIQIQILKKKINEIENANKSQNTVLNETKKLLTKEKLHTQNLERVITGLKNEKYMNIEEVCEVLSLKFSILSNGYTI